MICLSFFCPLLRASLHPSGFIQTTLEIIVVLPVNSAGDPTSIDTTGFMAFASRFPSHSFRIVNLSDWTRTHYPPASTSEINLALVRDRKFLDYFRGALTVENVVAFIQSGECSWVTRVDNTSSAYLSQCGHRCFLLSSPKLYRFFEDASFLYRYSKQHFFYYQTDTIGCNVTFFDFRHDVTRVFDSRVSLRQFVQSCVVPRSPSFSTVMLILPLTLIALVDGDDPSNMRIANESREFLAGSFSVRHSVVEWADARPYLDLCLISRNDMSFILLMDLAPGRQVCWLFPDMDFYSKERLGEFVRQGISRYLTPIQFDDADATGSANVTIPRPVPAVVLFSNPGSLSNLVAEETFGGVAQAFSGRNVAFIRFDQSKVKVPPYMPSTDGFPLIAFWGPNDKRPHVFREILSVEAVVAWIDSCLILLARARIESMDRVRIEALDTESDGKSEDRGAGHRSGV
jgi:hypothetical protein